MGRCIHYGFEMSGGNDDVARECIEKMRRRALELPFESVDEIEHVVGDEDRIKWFGQFRTDSPPATPDELIGFSTQPGDGCDMADFGLRKCAAGYCWNAYCKTSNTNGNQRDYLRCHLSVIAMLDYAQELGLLCWVEDDSGYWERRDWVYSLLSWSDWAECDLWPNELIAVSKQLYEWFGPLKEKAAFLPKE